VALAGQPNVGKSTVFNMLTGMNQHVGNWPGKTIEQKTGSIRLDGRGADLVDLPGTYSLSANSEEERIARDYLLRERPDVVIALVNAAALERSLYLVAELLALDLPVVVGLNMLDVASQRGVHVEPHVLQAALGVPVVPLVATRNSGVEELARTALRAADDPASLHPNKPAIKAEHRPVLEQLRFLINGGVPEPYPDDWAALKLLEGDPEITAAVRAALPPERWAHVHALLAEHEDAFLDIAGGRYEWIGRMVRAAVAKPRAGAIARTDQLDRLATHPVWGVALLMAMLGAVFALTYAVATPVAEWLSGHVLAGLTSVAGALLAGAPPLLQSFVVDGVINGAGTVLTFLPVLIVFFAALGMLEDSGYLARGAYVTDRFMHSMGLHGKSFMPLFLGFGCNVPAIMGTRIIEEPRARHLTMILAPLVPCTARIAVIVFLAPAFFGAWAPLVSWGLVAANLVVLALAGIAIHRLAFAGEHSAFIMELPLYHRPNGRTVGRYVWDNTTAFVRKAGTLILLAAMAIWALSTLPGGTLESSALAAAGRWIEPAGKLMGFPDWRAPVALLSSFFAKENTIASLAVLYGSEPSGAMAAQVALTLAPAAKLALLAVAMLFIPCLASVATIKQESGSWRWTAASMALPLVVSIAVGMGIYQIGKGF
jgi:ferrous iron transport protein B